MAHRSENFNRRNDMPSVLDGIRVIDFGQYIAGPLAGMLLADQGADVIRVDPPGGPMWDTPATATRLIESADVLIENFRPGVMRRLGLGPDAASRVNPRLVYCSLPGFATD